VNQGCNKKTVLFGPNPNPFRKMQFFEKDYYLSFIYLSIPIIGLYNKHEQKFLYNNMQFSILFLQLQFLRTKTKLNKALI